MKGNSAVPGGLLASKPTWPNTHGCLATSVFLFLSAALVRTNDPPAERRRGRSRPREIEAGRRRHMTMWPKPRRELPWTILPSTFPVFVWPS